MNRNLHGIYAMDTVLPALDEMTLETLTAEQIRHRVWNGEGFKTAQHWYLPLHGFGIYMGGGLYGSTATANDDDRPHLLAILSNTYAITSRPEEVQMMTLSVTAYEPGIRQALGMMAQ